MPTDVSVTTMATLLSMVAGGVSSDD